MTERQFSEVERALLAIGDAASRSKKALAAVTADGAEAHVINALSAAHESLSEVYRDLAQGTYYAVQPEEGVGRARRVCKVRAERPATAVPSTTGCTVVPDD